MSDTQASLSAQVRLASSTHNSIEKMNALNTKAALSAFIWKSKIFNKRDELATWIVKYELQRRSKNVGNAGTFPRTTQNARIGHNARSVGRNAF